MLYNVAFRLFFHNCCFKLWALFSNTDTEHLQIMKGYRQTERFGLKNHNKNFTGHERHYRFGKIIDRCSEIKVIMVDYFESLE